MPHPEIIDEEEGFSAAAVRMSTAAELLQEEPLAEDEAGVPSGEPDAVPQDLSLVETPIYVPDDVQAAWNALVSEGIQPTFRTVKARLKSMGGSVGSSGRLNAALRVLRQRGATPPPIPDAVAAAKTQLAQAAEQYDAWVRTCQEAHAEVDRCLHGWRELERTRLTRDDVSLDDLAAAIEAHRQADVRATQVLPPLGPVLEAAAIAAAGAVQQAIVEDQRQRYNALGDQRRALVTGPLEETLSAFLEHLHTLLDNIAEQQQLTLDLGLPPGNAVQQVCFWLYGSLRDLVPYPPRDRYFYNPFPVVDDLTTADPTMQPLTAEELPQAVTTARLWVQFRGGESPNFSSPGLEQLRQNLLNQRAFQQGKALEVSHDEEQALRARYGDAIHRVLPPVWR